MSRFAKQDLRKKGVALILTALMLTLIVPMVGLAIDAGVLYAIRARAQTACDAAALGAARALSVGLTLAAQEQSARQRANNYFDANFPVGAMETGTGATRTISILVEETGFRSRRVTVTADLQAPAYFMRYLGWGTGSKLLRVITMGQASRRDVNVIMVVDRSGSLQSAGACDDLEAASIAFVNQFANQRDRLGLITFGGASNLDYAPTMAFKDRPALTSKLDLLYPGGCNGWTGSAQALWQGYQQILTINEPGALNVILFFTDGNPNALTAQWPVRTVTTPELSYKSRCYDWINNKYYTDAGWNPAGQTYLGFMAIQYNPSNGRDGIRGHVAGAMPVSDDPGRIAIPYGYSGSAKSTSSDCYYRSNPAETYKDFGYIPNTDYFGTSVFGWKSVTTWPAGHPFAGKARLSSSDYTSGQNAAINAVDNVAARIRAKAGNPNISTVIYVIGLGGVGAAEDALLMRISNDKDSPIYDPTAPEGLYIYAPSATQLNAAFVQIASEILRYDK